MTSLHDALNRPLYLCIAYYSDVLPSPVATACYGNGVWLDAEDAADHWAEAVRENRPARVMRIDLEARTAREAIEVYGIVQRRMRERGIAAE